MNLRLLGRNDEEVQEALRMLSNTLAKERKEQDKQQMAWAVFRDARGREEAGLRHGAQDC
eukprot:10454611-Heterocapsa_arctica.AAC.1